MNRAWLIATETMTHVDAYVLTSEGLREYLGIPLSDVPPLLGEGSAQFFCPSEWVSFLDIQLPEVKPSLLNAIIPNLVEEMLAEPIESVHWAIAQERQNEEGKTTVAVIHRAHMENIINMFHPVGVTLDAIYPDVYVIPVLEEGWNCWVKGLRMLVREDKFHGFSLRQAESANWFAAMKVPEKTILYGANDEVNVPPVKTWIATLATDPPSINLMQGPFEPKTDKSNPSRLKYSLYALGGAIACYFIFLMVENVVLWHRLSALQAETLSLYQEVIPDATQATSPRVVLERELQRRGVGDQTFFSLLSALSQALGRESSIFLVHLEYEGDQLTATIEAKDFESLDAWTSTFKGASIVFQQEGAKREDGRVTARIRLEQEEKK